jgi:hypothetical protein
MQRCAEVAVYQGRRLSNILAVTVGRVAAVGRIHCDQIRRLAPRFSNAEKVRQWRPVHCPYGDAAYK